METTSMITESPNMDNHPTKMPRLACDNIQPIVPLSQPKMSVGLSEDSVTPAEEIQEQPRGAPAKDYLESQIIIACSREMSTYRSCLAFSDGLVQELESWLNATRPETAYEKSRISWEAEKAAIETKRRQLELTLAETTKCRDEAISARLELTRMLVKEIFLEEEINKSYMDGYADALNEIGVPHNDPIWLSLSFPYPRCAPRLAPGWGLTAGSRARLS